MTIIPRPVRKTFSKRKNPEPGANRTRGKELSHDSSSVWLNTVPGANRTYLCRLSQGLYKGPTLYAVLRSGAYR